MYLIVSHRKYEKRFKQVYNSLSSEDQQEFWNFLENSPKGNPTSHTICKKVKKKYQFDVPGGQGYRAIYDVDDRSKEVLILFIGDHQEAKAFIKSL